MGWRDRRARRGMTDPVRGEFRVTGTYRPPHQASSNFNDMLTGVIVADGVPPTPAEHHDRHVLGETNGVLPVLVDRADPTRSIVLWDEVRPVDYRAQARQRAEAAAHQVAQGTSAGAPSAQGTSTPDPDVTVVDPSELPPWLANAVARALDGGTADTTVHVDIGHGGTSGFAGEPSAAVLLAVTDVPTPPYVLPGPTASLTDLTLRVTRPDGSTYQTQTRMGFRSAERRAALAVIGSRVPVRVDPSDESHVAVDIASWG